MPTPVHHMSLIFNIYCACSRGCGAFGNANAGRGAFGNANAVRNVGRGAFDNANAVRNVGRRAFGNAILNCKFEFFL